MTERYILSRSAERERLATLSTTTGKQREKLELRKMIVDRLIKTDFPALNELQGCDVSDELPSRGKNNCAIRIERRSIRV